MDVPVPKRARQVGRERHDGPEASEPSTPAASTAPATSTPRPPPLPEAQRLEAQRLEAQRLEAQRLAEQPLESQQREALGPGEAASKASAALPAAFTSAIRHLSLYAWLRWVHSKRSDATVRVETDHGSGTVWCSGGLIIDAEWEGRVAEDALRELLPCSSGVMTIDFEPVRHLRRVVTPTHQLLRLADTDAAGTAEQRPGATPVAGSQGIGAGKDRFTELALLLAESVAPVAASQPPKARRWTWRRGHVATGLIVAGLALAGFAVGRQRANHGVERLGNGEPGAAESRAAASSTTTSSATASSAGSSAPGAAQPSIGSSSNPPPAAGKARELEPIPFVSLEVEPANAEIWLDRQLAGRGTLKLAVIHDGMMHELRFMAPEHETKALFFRDTPPAGRVVLARVGAGDGAPRAEAGAAAAKPRAAVSDVSDVSAARDDGRSANELEASRRAPRARVAAVVAAPPTPPRARAVPLQAPAPAKPVGERAPHIELIEVHAPRVQVLD